MALTYPDGVGITVIDDTVLKASDAKFPCLSVAGAAQQALYSEIRDAIIAEITTLANLITVQGQTVTLGNSLTVEAATPVVLNQDTTTDANVAYAQVTVGNTGIVVGVSIPFSDAAGTLTLQNIDALDATTEATIEAAIDTLANLTSLTIKGTTGGLTRQFSEVVSAALSGATTDIAIDVPTNCVLISVQLRVDTAITSGDGATSWGAAYLTGAAQAICTGQAFTKQTKVNTFFDPKTDSPITTDVTKIRISADPNTFNGGVIRAICYYESLDAMGDAA